MFSRQAPKSSHLGPVVHKGLGDHPANARASPRDQHHLHVMVGGGDVSRSEPRRCQRLLLTHGWWLPHTHTRARAADGFLLVCQGVYPSIHARTLPATSKSREIWSVEDEAMAAAAGIYSRRHLGA